MSRCYAPHRQCRCSSCMLRSNPERDAYYMRALTLTLDKEHRRFCQAAMGMSIADLEKSRITRPVIGEYK